jgi:hypothetical protein
MEILKIFCVLSDTFTSDRIYKMQVAYVAMYFIFCGTFYVEFCLHCAGFGRDDVPKVMYELRKAEALWPFACLMYDNFQAAYLCFLLYKHMAFLSSKAANNNCTSAPRWKFKFKRMAAVMVA